MRTLISSSIEPVGLFTLLTHEKRRMVLLRFSHSCATMLLLISSKQLNKLVFLYINKCTENLSPLHRGSGIFSNGFFPHVA